MKNSINNSDLVHIREMYTISQRLEEKIDNLDKRLSNMEGKATILSVVWSSIISTMGLMVGYFGRR